MDEIGPNDTTITIYTKCQSKFGPETNNILSSDIKAFNNDE